MVALKNLDPLFSANQLLAQANSFFGQTWNPDREIDFNKMVDTQNVYDARQRASDAQEYAADELSNAKTPEDVDRIQSEFARIMGDPLSFGKVQEEQRQREQNKQLSDLYKNGSSLEDLAKEYQKIRLGVGDIEGALKLQPKPQEDVKLGRQILRRNSDGSYTPIYTRPDTPKEEDNDEYMYNSDGEAVKVGSKEYHSAIGTGEPLASLPELRKQQALKEQEREAEKNKPGILDRVGSLLGSASGVVGNKPMPPAISANDIASDPGTQTSLRNAAEMQGVPTTTIMVQGKPTQVYDFGPNSDPGRRYLKVNG